MFKINEINGEYIDTTSTISSVVGQAFHQAMEVYYGGSDTLIPTSESEAIEYGMKTGLNFLEMYNDGFIKYSKAIPTKEKAYELFSAAFNEYVKHKPYGKYEVVGTEQKIEESISVEWKGQQLELPIPLKGRLDKVERDSEGRLIIVDYKTCSRFSDPEVIDGKKLIAAVVYYLLAYAYYGEIPYAMRYEELKLTKNSDGSPQLREYVMVFTENDLYFDFFFRLYEDMTRALNGEAVFVPNLNALYDNEVALVSYIHRLDVDEERAKLMKKHNVDNITSLLKKQLASASNMRQLMRTIEKEFVSAKTLDYSKMTKQEKIQTKLMEHGMMVQFDSMVHGSTVDMYRYTPSIGLKMSRIRGYVDDVEQVLGVSGIRILAPIPGTTFVGFEVPREERNYPDLPINDGFNLEIGVDTSGNRFQFDIREAPHLLVAGATGSGKSVFLNNVVKQLANIPQVDLYLADPKMVELTHFKKYTKQYESDIMGIHKMLQKAVHTMNDRYQKMAEKEVRSIKDMPRMKYHFIVVDEFGDLIVQKYIHKEYVHTGKIFQKGPKAGQEEVKTIETNISDEITKNILLLSQKGRAAGIHIIIATQRPSVDIITGTIKANFQTRVAFRMAKATDSQVLLDETGAERLLGKGDMLFRSERGLLRLQGYKE